MGQAFAVGEDGTFSGTRLSKAARNHHLQRRVEKDYPEVGEGVQDFTGRGMFDSASPQSENEVLSGAVACVFTDDVSFEGTKRSLTPLGEDTGDGIAGTGLDDCVAIEKAPAEGPRKHGAGGGFSGAHEASENNAADVR